MYQLLKIDFHFITYKRIRKKGFQINENAGASMWTETESIDDYYIYITLYYNVHVEFLQGKTHLLSTLNPKFPTDPNASCLLNLVAEATGGCKSEENEAKLCLTFCC